MPLLQVESHVSPSAVVGGLKKFLLPVAEDKVPFLWGLAAPFSHVVDHSSVGDFGGIPDDLIQAGHEIPSVNFHKFINKRAVYVGLLASLTISDAELPPDFDWFLDF